MKEAAILVLVQMVGTLAGFAALFCLDWRIAVAGFFAFNWDGFCHELHRLASCLNKR